MRYVLLLNQRLRAVSVHCLLVLCSSTTLAQSSTSRSANAAEFADGQMETNSSPRVTSDSDRALARTHAIAGFGALDAKAYMEAVAQFTKALDLLEAPTLRVGRGDALVELNQWSAAQADYRVAATDVAQPGDSAALVESRAEANEKLLTLTARMPRLRVGGDAAQVEVVVDDLPPQILSRGATLDLDPGPHTVRITVDGRSVTHSVDARPEAEHVVEGPSAPPVMREVASEPSASELQTSPSRGNEMLVAGTITSVLTVGAVVTGILFLNNHGRYNDVREDPSASESRVDELYRATQTLQWVNTGLTAAAVVGAGVTTYFWLAPRSDGPQYGTPGTSALSKPHGVIMGAAGRF